MGTAQLPGFTVDSQYFSKCHSSLPCDSGSCLQCPLSLSPTDVFCGFLSPLLSLLLIFLCDSQLKLNLLWWMLSFFYPQSRHLGCACTLFLPSQPLLTAHILCPVSSISSKCACLYIFHTWIMILKNLQGRYFELLWDGLSPSPTLDLNFLLIYTLEGSR